MSVHGYEIKTAFDFYRKLLDEREDFLKNPSSSRHAINCAITAWQLHEWVYKEYKNHPALSNYKTITEFRNYLYSAESFQTIHDLADGSKHFSLTKRVTTVLNTRVIKGGEKFGRKEVKADTLVVTVTFADVGLSMTFDDLLYLITLFWYNFFRQKLNLQVEDFSSKYTLF